MAENDGSASEAMSALEFLEVATGFVGVVIVAGFAVTVLVQIWRGQIDLTKLVSEKDGSASLSRFQFLIFTFVIGLSLVLLVIANVNAGTIEFPEINAGVWTLLGISGGSYVVSKGIQGTNEAAKPEVKPKPEGWSGADQP